jgi:hypothetical protein
MLSIWDFLIEIFALAATTNAPHEPVIIILD